MQNQVQRESGGDRWARELTPQEKSSYAKAMKELRASYGLTDGLRTTPAGMNDYLARRRAEDEMARTGR